MTLAIRKDDARIGAFLRQLEDIEAQVQREEFAELGFANGDYVPLDIQNKPGYRTTTYRKVTAVGQFKLHRNYSTEVPMVNMLSEEFTQTIHKWIGGYYISDDDIDAARLLQQISLEQEDVASVREAAMMKLNQLIAFGDPDLNMPGFLNNPDALHTYSPIAINSSSTPNQILAMLNDAASSPVVLTKQVEKPDTMILSVKPWHYMTTVRVSDYIDKTIMKQFLENTPYIKNVGVVNECQGAGVDGGDIIVMFRRDRMKLKAMVYEDFQFKPMERKGFGYSRPAYFRYAGLRMYRPYSVNIVTLPPS
jgi:hypothetical protein